MAKNLRYGTNEFVTIASSGTTATTWTMEGNRVPVAIILPSAFSGTQLSFQASVDAGATFSNVYDEATQYTVNVGASRYISLKRQPFEGVRYLRITSASTETAARSILTVSGEY